MLGTYQSPEQFFGRSFTSQVFSQLERYSIPVVREWTIDQIVGYLYSTSFASRVVLKDRASSFERDLRDRLELLSPSGVFTEKNHFSILFARRSPEDTL